jgi:hypothetical protein
LQWLNVGVVLFDCLLSDPARIRILVVDVCHHLSRDPHRPAMIDPQLDADDRHQEQREGGAHAVQKIGALQPGFNECPALTFNPATLVDILRIKLL